MKGQHQEHKPNTETRLELKYCERCGGLWLRPTGGEQVYCMGCSRQMAELPAATDRVGRAKMKKGPTRGCDEEAGCGGEESDLNAMAEVWNE